MEVQVISDTIQKFNGVSYYKCGFYFQRKGVRLHRTVWEYHHGPIPKGYDIHHIDENRYNNQIENLQLMAEGDHGRLHSSTEEKKKICRENVKKAIAAAPAWHHSEAGKAWHSQHAKEIAAVQPYRTYNCTWCGAEFKSKHHYGDGKNHFCCNNHKAAFRRNRIRNENSINQTSST